MARMAAGKAAGVGGVLHDASGVRDPLGIGPTAVDRLTFRVMLKEGHDVATVRDDQLELFLLTLCIPLLALR